MELNQRQVDFLRSTRVHFCIPCYGGQITEGTFTSMMKFMATANRLGMNFTLDTLTNESLVQRARNSLVAKMLQFGTDTNPPTPSTHLMFVDADIAFEPEEVIKLVLSDKDIVGGLYPKKALPIAYVVNKIPNAVKEGNLVEVANLGTGFMLIKRHVLEKLIMSHPEWHYADSIGLDEKYSPFKYSLFDCETDSVTREYLSEDYLFCKRWRQHGTVVDADGNSTGGGKIFADLSIVLGHSGYYQFKGDATILQPHL